MRYKQVMFILCIFVFACFLPPLCISGELDNSYIIPDDALIVNSHIGFLSDAFEKQRAIYLDGVGHNLLFLHPFISETNSHEAQYLGFGYRSLMNDNNFLLGVNSILNLSEDEMFSFQGIGIEAFYQMFEFRAFSQFEFSLLHPDKLSVSHGEGSVQKYEAEIGLPIPFLNWVSLYGGAFWFDYENFTDSEGWKFRGEVRPFKYIVLNLTAYDDGSTEYKADGAVFLPFDIFMDIPSGDELLNVGFSDHAYPDTINHSIKMMDNFRIDK